MGLMTSAVASLVGTKQTAAPVDFGMLTARLSAALRPHEDKMKRDADTWHEWSSAEARRPGANIETTPPEAVAQAINDGLAKVSEARRTFAADVMPAVRADYASRVEAVDALFAQLVEQVEELRQFERAYAAFAATCRAPMPTPLGAGLAASNTDLAAWRDRCEHALRPRVVVPAPRRALVLGE